jgi:hypothetical protein
MPVGRKIAINMAKKTLDGEPPTGSAVWSLRFWRIFDLDFPALGSAQGLSV